MPVPSMSPLAAGRVDVAHGYVGARCPEPAYSPRQTHVAVSHLAYARRTSFWNSGVFPLLVAGRDCCGTLPYGRRTSQFPTERMHVAPTCGIAAASLRRSSRLPTPVTDSGKPSRYHRDEHPQVQSQSSFLDKSDAFTVQPTMPHTSMTESTVNATFSSPATQCEVEVGVGPRPPAALDTRILSTHSNVCMCGNEDDSDVPSRRPVRITRSSTTVACGYPECDVSYTGPSATTALDRHKFTKGYTNKRVDGAGIEIGTHSRESPMAETSHPQQQLAFGTGASLTDEISACLNAYATTPQRPNFAATQGSRDMPIVIDEDTPHMNMRRKRDIDMSNHTTSQSTSVEHSTSRATGKSLVASRQRKRACHAGMVSWESIREEHLDAMQNLWEESQLLWMYFRELEQLAEDPSVGKFNSTMCEAELLYCEFESLDYKTVLQLKLSFKAVVGEVGPEDVEERRITECIENKFALLQTEAAKVRDWETPAKDDKSDLDYIHMYVYVHGCARSLGKWVSFPCECEAACLNMGDIGTK
ncbi:hypothetical protein T440DRAFT_528423 [Plenodomus tracheiphilus IPT5]|uniref:Uncharacterized protein n=1 Tax=Plenodomus tracheiphilus IPT5 TaxID=1408161 RepID=A0A6A7ALR9_9PLEO|nr:hypothetical protein T440DRAFT_528423 [Plenodomus tracheiphilus IPT5]